MNNRCATVNRILPFSCVDGPGNRLVIFLQGCNFRCPGCHNPYTINRCNHCGDCVSACPYQALSLVSGKVVWQADVCQQCDTCLQTCKRNASPMTRQYSVSDILDLIRRYLPFLSGITCSGGEATLQLPYLIELFTAIRQEHDLKHLTCFIDSNGNLSEFGWKKVLPVMDGAMIDLKAWDPLIHQQLTGRSNHSVLNTLKLLAIEKKLHEVRLLVIPDETDFIQHIEDLTTFLRNLDPNIHIRLNAFQHHGVKGEAKSWRTAQQQDIEQLAQLLQQNGLNNITKPVLYLP